MVFAMQPPSYELGRVYPKWLPPGKNGRWPEGTRYTYDEEGHTLLVYFPRVSERERRDFQHGDAEFALLYEPPVIFLLFKFGGQFWMEAPFCIHQVPESRRLTTVIEPGGRVWAELDVHLVDSAYHSLSARRKLTLPEEFALQVEEMIWEQLDAGWDGREHYAAALERIYEHEETEDLLARAVCRTVIRQRPKPYGEPSERL